MDRLDKNQLFSVLRTRVWKKVQHLFEKGVRFVGLAIFPKKAGRIEQCLRPDERHFGYGLEVSKGNPTLGTVLVLLFQIP